MTAREKLEHDRQSVLTVRPRPARSGMVEEAPRRGAGTLPDSRHKRMSEATLKLQVERVREQAGTGGRLPRSRGCWQTKSFTVSAKKHPDD